MAKREILVETIIKDKLSCAFISPHFDDAVFSCGGLISLLAGKTKLTVINVFTEAGAKNSLSAKAYLAQCKTKNAIELYKLRREEDQKILKSLKITVISLGMTEALWRQKKHKNLLDKLIPEFGLIYPTYRWHIKSGKISSEDNTVYKEIVEKLRQLESSRKFDLIFAPYGIGGHIDHVLSKKAAKNLKGKVIFWLDYPYLLNEEKVNLSKKSFIIKPDWKKKKSLMKKYKTQYNAVFSKNELKEIDEVYLA